MKKEVIEEVIQDVISSQEFTLGDSEANPQYYNDDYYKILEELIEHIKKFKK